jgi:hypothetical protein
LSEQAGCFACPSANLEGSANDLQLVWRSDVPAEVAALYGQRLQAVELLEWAGGTRITSDIASVLGGMAGDEIANADAAE